VAKKNGQPRPKPPALSAPEPQSWLNRYSGALSLASLVVVVGLTLVNIGFLSGVWNTKLDQALRNTDDLGKRISKLENSVANIQGRLGSLGNILYREKAASYGFKDPQILPVALSLTAPPLKVVSSPTSPFSYSLEFKILKITPESITFSMDGEVNTNRFKDGLVTVPFQVGVPVDLLGGFHFDGDPHIFLTILDLPAKDQAIVAVGSKTEAAA
jgi:hypothetical protein